jgi:hypothetical protein
MVRAPYYKQRFKRNVDNGLDYDFHFIETSMLHIALMFALMKAPPKAALLLVGKLRECWRVWVGGGGIEKRRSRAD